MFKSFSKKVLLILICLILLANNLVYADTVVVGVAPGNGTKNIDSNATTTYLQNQYNGPGIMPSSAMTNYSPMQGVSVDYSVGKQLSAIDSNNTSDGGPTVKNISSPAAHNKMLSESTGNVNVISNGFGANGTGTDSTSDTGPTVREIKAPVADGEVLYSDGAGPGNSQVGGAPTSIPSYNTNSEYNNVPQTKNSASSNATLAYNDVVIYTVNNNIQAVKPSVSAAGALVVNASTRQIYFSKGGLDAFHPAALATLVTAALLVKFKRLEDVLTVSATAVTGLESGASTAGLKAGDTITVRDAIGAMFVRSCCDVANVVAENVAGSIPNFVALMNQTVKNWGCVGTVFTNPTGLNSDAQVTNTYDAAIIMDKVSSDPALKVLLLQHSYALPATSTRGAKTLTTTNQLLIPGNKNYYTGIGGSKLGYTSKAKYTIASEIDYNGQRLIAIVLKANGSQFTDSIKLLNFAKVASIEAGNTVTYNTILNVANNVSAQTVANTNLSNLPSAAGNTALVNTNETQGTWHKDTKGWYFIKPNGQSAANEWIKQGNKVFCVDSTGYMITGWRQMSNGEMYYFDPASGELRFNTWVNVSTGAYYLQSDGTLARAPKGTTKNITTAVGTYTIDENGKALAKVS